MSTGDNRLLWGSVVGGFVVLLVAAGAFFLVTGGENSSDSAAPVRAPAEPESDNAGPCALLSSEEIADVVGQEMGEGTETDTGDGLNCEWLAVAESDVDGISVAFKVELGIGDASVARDLFARDGDDVADLGDRARVICGLSGDFCNALGPLIVVDADTAFLVDFANFESPADLTEAEAQEQLRALAELVLDRI